VIALLMVVLGVAGPSSWTQGTPAAGAARVTQPISENPVVLKIPDHLSKYAKGPLLVVFLSPTCPHCHAITPELSDLAKRSKKKLKVVAIVSANTSPEAVAEYQRTYRPAFDVVVDTQNQMIAQMGARSTPSAILMDANQDGGTVMDVWYPLRSSETPLIEMRLAGDPFAVFTPGRYLGSAACGACHTHEMEAWSLTHHSVAWRTLVRTGADSRNECISCHVTGMDDGGWTSGDHALENVGCESCHGAGGPHDGVSTNPSKTCANCHDAKHSVQFDLDRAMPLIDHYQALSMSDEAFMMRRRELHSGNAAQELLSFLGPTQEAQACSSCHPNEVASWKASPHATAMSHLTGESAQDPSCVRCHATPIEAGVGTADVQDFRVEESVGCASCHGPGEKHMASQAAEDILGLGASCPECVIDAVCTSCHTSEWDKDWDLQTHFPRAGHK